MLPQVFLHLSPRLQLACEKGQAEVVEALLGAHSKMCWTLLVDLLCICAWRLEADPERAIRLKDCLDKWSGFSALGSGTHLHLALFSSSRHVKCAERPCTSSPTVATKKPPRPSCVGALSRVLCGAGSSQFSEPQSQVPPKGGPLLQEVH